MNYKLKVDTNNIDKVVLKLTEEGSAVKIKNVLRRNGFIFIKTGVISKVKMITEILEIEKESFFPKFSLF